MHWTPHGDHSYWCHIAKVSGVCHYGYFQYLPIHCDSYITPKNAILLCLLDDCDLIDVIWTWMFERCPCHSLVICQHIFFQLRIPSSSLCLLSCLGFCGENRNENRNLLCTWCLQANIESIYFDSLGILKSGFPQGICTSLLMTVLSVVGKTWKQPDH